MKKFLLLMILLVTTPVTLAEFEVEIPLLKLVEMKYNDVDPSSNPDVMWRQFEYTSSASPKELLKFYEDNKFTESCPYNDMADNYMCKLAEQGRISTGHVFIPSKSKGDITVILADYFFMKQAATD